MTNPVLIPIFAKDKVLFFPWSQIWKNCDIKGIAHGKIFSSEVWSNFTPSYIIGSYMNTVYSYVRDNKNRYTIV